MQHCKSGIAVAVISIVVGTLAAVASRSPTFVAQYGTGMQSLAQVAAFIGFVVGVTALLIAFTHFSQKPVNSRQKDDRQ